MNNLVKDDSDTTFSFFQFPPLDVISKLHYNDMSAAQPVLDLFYEEDMEEIRHMLDRCYDA